MFIFQLASQPVRKSDDEELGAVLKAAPILQQTSRNVQASQPYQSVRVSLPVKEQPKMDSLSDKMISGKTPQERDNAAREFVQLLAKQSVPPATIVEIGKLAQFSGDFVREVTAKGDQKTADKFNDALSKGQINTVEQAAVLANKWGYQDFTDPEMSRIAAYESMVFSVIQAIIAAATASQQQQVQTVVLQLQRAKSMEDQEERKSELDKLLERLGIKDPLKREELVVEAAKKVKDEEYPDNIVKYISAHLMHEVKKAQFVAIAPLHTDLNENVNDYHPAVRDFMKEPLQVGAEHGGQLPLNSEGFQEEKIRCMMAKYVGVPITITRTQTLHQETLEGLKPRNYDDPASWSTPIKFAAYRAGVMS